LLLNGLASGFVLAQQAIEKMLKAYLHIAHPNTSRFVGPKGLVQAMLHVTASHDLVAHATLVENSFPDLSLNLVSQYGWLLEELSLHFDRKYPDSSSPHNSSTTEWLNSIDRLMLNLSINIPVDEKTRWRTGVFASSWPLILTNQPNPPWSIWVRESNLAFHEAFDQIRSVVIKGHQACYPGQPL